MRLSTPMVVIGGVVVATAVGVGALAATGTLDDLLEPLVGADDEGDLAPLVEEGETIGPGATVSIPPGTELAEAYRIEVIGTSDTDLQVDVGGEAPAGTQQMETLETYVGDLVRVSDGRYEGRVMATSQASYVGEFLGEHCAGAWDGRQTVLMVGIVRTDESLPDYVQPSDDPGGVYLPLYVTEPLGSVDWSDPDNDCEGETSPALPLTYGDPDSTSALGGSVPRLPPPGFGMVEERFPIRGPLFLGPFQFTDATTEWVFRITPIDREEAEEAEVIEGDPLEIPSLVFDVSIDGGPDDGTYAGTLRREGFDEVECALGPTGLTVSVYADAELSYLYLEVPDPESATSGTDAFFFSSGFDGATDGPTIAPADGLGEGSASVTLTDDAAEIEVVGETDEGVGIQLEARCSPLGEAP